MKDNLQIPRIALTIIENSGKTYHLRPTVRRMRKIMRNSLKLKTRMNTKYKLTVIYGKSETNQGKVEVFDNQAETKNISELRLIFEAFIDRGLWIPKGRR